MTLHNIAIACGWLAVSIGLWGVSSQLRRAIRVGVEGISLATWLLFSLVAVYWSLYGFVVHSLIVILGTGVMFPVQFAIVLVMKPWRSLIVVSRCCLFFAVCCIVPTLLWGWPAGIYGATIVTVVNRVPQFVALVRERNVIGVSAASWLIAFLGGAFWLVYYINLHKSAAIASVCITMFTNSSIAALATWRHRVHQSEVEILKFAPT
jgi:uncharacterized protein with PQ loop repeat